MIIDTTANIRNKLYNKQQLNALEAKQLLFDIVSGKYNDSQIASFIAVYLIRPIYAEELTGFRNAMIELCLKINFSDYTVTDIVGTGGDNKNTINISTLSSLVVAATGIKIVKHGNYGVSSVSGSSNILESLGYTFTSDESRLKKQLDETNFCFLHAPLFHPAMKKVAGIRRDLAVRTFFNLLGPLINPCNPQNILLGVYNLETARLYNYALQSTNINYAIVHSYDGYDEISLTSTYKIITRNREEVKIPTLPISPDSLSAGNSIETAKKIFLNILMGEGTAEQNKVIATNAALALTLNKPKINFVEACQICLEALVSKKVYQLFKKLTYI